MAPDEGRETMESGAHIRRDVRPTARCHPAAPSPRRGVVDLSRQMEDDGIELPYAPDEKQNRASADVSWGGSIPRSMVGLGPWIPISIRATVCRAIGPKFSGFDSTIDSIFYPISASEPWGFLLVVTHHGFADGEHVRRPPKNHTLENGGLGDHDAQPEAHNRKLASSGGVVRRPGPTGDLTDLSHPQNQPLARGGGWRV